MCVFWPVNPGMGAMVRAGVLICYGSLVTVLPPMLIIMVAYVVEQNRSIGDREKQFEKVFLDQWSMWVASETTTKTLNDDDVEDLMERGFQRRYRCAWIWWATLCGTILTAMIIWSCLSSKPVIMLALTIGYGLVIVIVPALAILGYAKSSESERDRERVNDAVEENFEVRWVEWVENETSSYKFTEEVKAGVVESGDEASCAICLSEYELNDDIRGLPCGHAFHAECFAECFHGLPRGRKASQHRCPLCRASLGPVLPRRLIDGSYEVTDIATPTPDGDLEVGVADEEAGNN
ncbi:hypothetical protein FOL47_009841 [Perkinsus chesapeaki]|uniref:RING-type E3 ubiquitin transferase n=1 Tax=Perkinsus chesapeaki TaxID=330153 RepID=A0A7J6L660_PERCH|nr:hypothetical protein FOL47_009841 [Perkinsus chesapeaki]